MGRAMASALVLWHRFTITRYLAASMIALAFDVALFSSIVALGIDPTIASATGYCAGIVVHWLVSANIVFAGKTRDGAARHVQRALFAGSAMIGLGLTVATVEILGRFGVHPIPSKGVAIGISFVAVYAMRKWGVFR
ncbi:MAG: GtrA family protein [Sphingopyxis sp.]|nr:GtrA family protein [Sphingopyxis sp.]